MAKRLPSLLLVLMLMAGCAAPHSTPPAAGEAPADVPEAFHSLGRLAFIKEGKVYVLDGGTDTVRVVEGSSGAQAVAWSPDGPWLAFLQESEESRHLIVAEAASGQATEATGLPGPVSGFEWAPDRNVLAVSVSPPDIITGDSGSRMMPSGCWMWRQVRPPGWSRYLQRPSTVSTGPSRGGTTSLGTRATESPSQATS